MFNFAEINRRVNSRGYYNLYHNMKTKIAILLAA